MIIKSLSITPQVKALAALFVARMARKSMKGLNVLKEAGYFFTRPADVLKREVEHELKRTGKLGFKPDIMRKHQSVITVCLLYITES